MKLRLRSLESRGTLRLELPASCTLQQLKESLCQAISSSPSSLHFSLNRKDELHASSSQASLQSVGVTGGDLIYYSCNPTAFVSENQDVNVQNPNSREIPLDNEIVGANSGKEENPLQEAMTEDSSQGISVLDMGKSKEAVISDDCEIPDARMEVQQNPVQEYEKIEASGANSQEPISKCGEIYRETPVQETPIGRETQGRQETPIIGETQGKLETLEFPSSENMDIEERSEQVPVNRMAEPYFMRRVLREELGDGVGAQGLVVLAIHAVLLESGFVGFDTVSGMRVDRFDVPNQLLSTGISMSYTLQELLNHSSCDVTEFVALKYQTLGHFVNVYGSLGKDDSGMHKVFLNAYKFGPIIDVSWTNSDEKCILDDKAENKNSYYGDEVFEFWKIVKDGLALPLLIDLCDKAGLSLPACLMRLPTELKLKIMESLPGVDMAKMECVSKEMRYLAINNDLWKQKFAQEFGGGSDAQGKTNWKDKFVRHWEYKKRREREITTWYPRSRLHVPIIREHVPVRDPARRGGDFDRNPYMPFAPFPFGRRRQGFAYFNERRDFAPNCNLGGT